MTQDDLGDNPSHLQPVSSCLPKTRFATDVVFVGHVFVRTFSLHPSRRTLRHLKRLRKSLTGYNMVFDWGLQSLFGITTVLREKKLLRPSLSEVTPIEEERHDSNDKEPSQKQTSLNIHITVKIQNSADNSNNKIQRHIYGNISPYTASEDVTMSRQDVFIKSDFFFYLTWHIRFLYNSFARFHKYLTRMNLTIPRNQTSPD